MFTAILIDGGFFLKRYRSLRGEHAPLEVARALHRLSLAHVRSPNLLFRIFYYDCPPLEKRVHDPISGRSIDLGKSSLAAWKRAFLDRLRRMRKVALRLGYLSERSGAWECKKSVLQGLLAGRRTLDSLTIDDLRYDVRQKGVDMRIGLDIATLAYKQLVDQIVLISGDSDFVPAAKLARREGIDFILDPMWSHVQPDLHEHIDGLRSTITPSTTSPDF